MVEPLAAMNGMPATAVPWPDALGDAALLLAESPAVVYVCRPNNPTGELAPREWIDQLLDARDGDGGGARDQRPGLPLVIVDEAYGDFAGETLIPLAASRPNVLVTRTASKAYGLAGLRCGFAVGDRPTALAVEKSRGPYKVAGLASEGAAAAIRDANGWMAARVAECVENRERLRAELEARGLVPPPSRANFLLCPAPSGSAARDAAALRGLGIGVRAFTEIPDMEEGLRVTIGPWPLMESFLEALDRTRGART
jgi:histidinol-phosphate aminotransferase